MSGSIDPELERALAGTPVPPARAEFRAALRRRFLEDQRSVDGAAAGAPPRRRFAPVLALIPLAAAIVIVVFLLKRSRPPEWEVLDGSTGGICVVDGRELDTADRAALATALRSALEVDSRDTTLRLRARDAALVELGPGTRLTSMRLPSAGRWSVRAETGSLRVATLPGFNQRGWTIYTPDMKVEVSGTAFAVDVAPQGTCVCCLVGELECSAITDGGSRAIDAGKMMYSYRAAQPCAFGASYEPHVAPLRALSEVNGMPTSDALTGALILLALFVWTCALLVQGLGLNARALVGRAVASERPGRILRRGAWSAAAVALLAVVLASGGLPFLPALACLAGAALLVWTTPSGGDAILCENGVRRGWHVRPFTELEAWRLTGQHLRFTIGGEWTSVPCPLERQEELRARLEQLAPGRESPWRD